MYDDFRNMTKFTSAKGAKVKWLQSTPTLRKKTANEVKQTGNILRKLMKRITEMIPEVQREKIRKSSIQYKIKDVKNKEESTNEEECLALMMNMKEEDISFYDDWYILQEEDFQTNEEKSQAKLQLARALEALMRAYFKAAEAKMEKMMNKELDKIEKREDPKKKEDS